MISSLIVIPSAGIFGGVRYSDIGSMDKNLFLSWGYFLEWKTGIVSESSSAELDSDTIPVFHSRKYPQERKRFLSIEPISEYLTPPKIPAEGITIRELITKIGKIRVLDLIRGDNLEELENE